MRKLRTDNYCHVQDYRKWSSQDLTSCLSNPKMNVLNYFQDYVMEDHWNVDGKKQIYSMGSDYWQKSYPTYFDFGQKQQVFPCPPPFLNSILKANKRNFILPSLGLINKHFKRFCLYHLLTNYNTELIKFLDQSDISVKKILPPKF